MIEIREAQAWHCGKMARILRHEHASCLGSTTSDIHRDLRGCFDASAWKRAGFVDGRLVGLGGVVGSALSSTGFIWLAMSQEVTAFPLATARILRKLLNEIMETHHELATVVIPEDSAALRLAVFMGFHCDYQGQGSPAFSRFGRQQLARYLRETPELRMTTGKTTGVVVGYRRQVESQHEL